MAPADSHLQARSVMGLVNSIGGRAMRPPEPPTYALVPATLAPGGGAVRAEFDPPWAPATHWAQTNGCPIRFAAARALGRDELAARAARLRHRVDLVPTCLLYTSPSPRDGLLSRMPSSA